MSKHSALLLLASEQRQSPRIIGEILNLLGAHPGLIDLPRAIDQLLRVLRACNVGMPIGFENSDVVVWREACGWIVSLARQPNIRERLGEQFWLGDKGSANNPVLHKGVKIFGFPYATFLHIFRDHGNKQNYERLLAQLLVASQKTATNRLLDQRYDVYKAIGHLCKLQTVSIASELNIWGSTEEFVASCRGFLHSKSRSENADSFAAIARFVRYCNGELPRVGGGGGGHRGKRKRQSLPELNHYISEDVRGFVLGDPDDPDQLPGHYDVIVGHTDTAGGDLAPGEMNRP